MAAVLTHYIIAELYNKKYKSYKEDDLIAFLIGSIAADAPRSQGKDERGRVQTHFGVSRDPEVFGDESCNLRGSVLNLKAFLEKYGNKLNNPFFEGYLLHLWADKLWFSELVMDIYDKHAKEIKPGAKSAKDIPFKYAYAWYIRKGNMYHTFDIHDVHLYPLINNKHIEDLTKYNVEECPIEELDKSELQKMIAGFMEKYNNLKDKELDYNDIPLISMERMNIFFDKCIEEVNKYINDNI